MDRASRDRGVEHINKDKSQILMKYALFSFLEFPPGRMYD